MEKGRVRDLERGSIIRWKGWWGVFEGKGTFYRWNAHPIRLKPDDVVEILRPRKPRRKKGE